LDRCDSTGMKPMNKITASLFIASTSTPTSTNKNIEKEISRSGAALGPR
jgi:hypothetical protein